MLIDLVIWEDENSRRIVVSAVSMAGCRIIASIVGLPEGALCGSAPLDICPDEFMSHIPKELRVYFYKRKEGTMTDMSELASKKLQ